MSIVGNLIYAGDRNCAEEELVADHVETGSAGAVGFWSY